MEKENFQIFSDESGYCGKDRFGSIAVISGPKSITTTLDDELKAILHKYNQKEIKFAGVGGNFEFMNATKECISLGIDYCRHDKIKIYVLVWDKHDSRHDIQGRDDIENLKYMYYKILKETKSDWIGVENWEFFPDELTSVNWGKEIVPFIERTNLDKKRNNDEETLFGVLKNFRFPAVRKCSELESCEYPILQLADLFAGLTRLSFEKSEKFCCWYDNEINGSSLFNEPILLSKSEIAKFQVMHHFKKLCDHYSMGLNLSDDKHFKVFNKRCGLWIWFYEPQGDYDKAPTKESMKNREF
jgi:hypothetical protein